MEIAFTDRELDVMSVLWDLGSGTHQILVPDGNGYHRFARTLEEHDKNVVAYRHAVASNR